MLCKCCGADLHEPDNVEEITAVIASHNSAYIDLILYCVCGAQYNTFVMTDNMLIISTQEENDAR